MHSTSLATRAANARGAALILGLVAVCLAIVCWVSLAASKQRPRGAPERLADTGLYQDFDARIVRAENYPFTPQYPLWSDGATKQRWIHLPRGTAIDASNPDAWDFPIGTRLWKEFSFGRRVETRYMERGDDGAWIYATYAWTDDERDAVRAPESGIRGACETGLGARHDIPSAVDCRACHTGSPAQVLGFSALQLSADRDPLAPHAETPSNGALDLTALVAKGLVRGLPADVVESAPRIAARTPRERAALGYLHGNCGSCHNATGPLAPLGLDFVYTLDPAARAERGALHTAVDRASQFRLRGESESVRIASGAPQRSVLAKRMSSRSPLLQMPPLGTHAVDADALALITDWIRTDLAAPRTAASEKTPTTNLNQ